MARSRKCGGRGRYANDEILTGDPSPFKWSVLVANSLPAGAVIGGQISDTPCAIDGTLVESTLYDEFELCLC